MTIMTLPSFNALHFARRLKEAEQIASKGDVFAVQTAVLKDVFAVQTDVLKVDAKVELVRKDVESLRWIMGAVLGGIIALIVRSFF